MLKKGRNMKSSMQAGRQFNMGYWGLSPMRDILCKLALQRIAKGPDKMSAKIAQNALREKEEGLGYEYDGWTHGTYRTKRKDE